MRPKKETLTPADVETVNAAEVAAKKEPTSSTKKGKEEIAETKNVTAEAKEATTEAEEATAEQLSPEEKKKVAAKKAKAKRTQRVTFPGLEPDDDDNATLKLKEIPKEFDLKVYFPLKRGDFEDETLWLIARAELYEKKAAAYRAEAKDWEKLGAIKDRTKAKKLVAMQRRMSELKEQLASQGIDVDALLGLGDDDEDDEDEGQGSA